MKVTKTIAFTLSLMTSLSGTIAHGSSLSELKASKPNIIFVITDDQGMGDLSCMGNEVVQTPHIDRFHDKALRFTDFQVSPTCAPTRAALMSGRVPFKNGVTHTIFQRERMALDTYTFPQALQSAGYATGLFGKWHLGDEDEYLPGSRGFDEVLMHGAGGIGQVQYGDFPPNGENTYFDNVLLHNDTIVQTEGFCTDIFFDAGLAWIRRQHEAEKPYFAYISLNAPHGPLIAPEKYKKRFLDLGYDAGTAGRYGMVENIDDNFGKMMTQLEEWGALDNTLVIFMTDNGATHLNGKLNGQKIKHYNANLKGGKNSPHEGGTHVPAFWQWQGVLAEGVDVDGLTAHIDLYKTFVELAGAELPDDVQQLDGRSLLLLLENPQADWADRELFFHCGRWNPGKLDSAKYVKCAVRSERWRLVNNKELYDIEADPFQQNDVAQSYPEVVQQLSQSYDKWWASVQPYMVNENLPKLRENEFPLNIRYYQQLKETGIPTWAPESY
ncbi:arylsulfatase [Coraliomargarita sp. SDUM461003]|uniref:Arylsulfatase n=1 Tax=Thalassobacterium maritimum TaxID=3041265 RepID=A0ABU1ATQ0_9BACT|nr:arylsulfatase [Coraliomargarita sp. SDUM461003]MDQ8207541.1 arylsulfatase [Coraliomargarita sp. SDUM461003]